MATITLKAGMVWKGAYDASVTYDKLDVVCNADKTQIAVCKQGGSGIPLTNSNYWEVSIDASGIIALLEDALAHGEIYTMKIGSVTTGATSSATIVNNHQTHETILNLVLEKGEKGDKGDKGDRGEKGDTTVIDPSTTTAYTLYNSEGDNTDGAMTQDAVTKEFEKLDEVYARNDGYYETMGVGMATNLKGQNTVDAEFAYRKSGGNVEVQDGNAMIEAIKGNTIEWNQNVNSLNVASEVYGITRELRGYALHYSGTSTQSANFTGAIMLIAPIDTHKYYLSAKGTPNTCRISKNGVTGTDSYVGTLSGTSFGVYIPEGVTIDADVYFACIDLTLIYGEGNEPSTPEQFEQDYFNWFGKPLTYEPYDAGSLRNTKVSALKTLGFNQFDEQVEIGNYSNEGVKVYGAKLRSKNLIPVISGGEYYYKSPVSCNIFLFGADAKTLVGLWIGSSEDFDKDHPKGSGQLQWNANTAKVIPSDCRYIAFSTFGSSYTDPSQLLGQFCINISNQSKNGIYEPYKESTLPLDVTTLTGKLNGEGSSVVVFADGMNSAGDVHDEICIVDGVTKAIKRVSSSHGVLAEPEVYVLDDFSLPKLYPVANGGTEEQLSNSANSLPATLSIRYGLNAAAFIQNAPKNYISKESMTNFLGNLGSAMGGTWSMTWNSSTNKYDFSFTQNRNVDVKQPIEDK